MMFQFKKKHLVKILTCSKVVAEHIIKTMVRDISVSSFAFSDIPDLHGSTFMARNFRNISIVTRVRCP